LPKVGEEIDAEELLQVTPLLAEPKPGVKPNKVTHAENQPREPTSLARVQVFNEEEETTKILEMRYLTWSCPKRFLLVPLLSLITGFFFLLFLYWYPKLRKRFLYSEVTSLSRATHLYIVGTGKDIFHNLLFRCP
jgi:hypothetical protein